MNMYVFNSFKRVEKDVGSTNLIGIYLFAALSSSLLSLAVKRARNIQIASVGASGALYGVVSCYALIHPNATFSIVFIPSDLFSFTAEKLFYFAVLFDLGSLLFWKRSPLDHAGHLGGLLAGVASYYALQPTIAMNNEVKARYTGDRIGDNIMHGRGELKISRQGATIVQQGIFEHNKFVQGKMFSILDNTPESMYKVEGLVIRDGMRSYPNTVLEGTFDINSTSFWRFTSNF
jgi:hypothetical protein